MLKAFRKMCNHTSIGLNAQMRFIFSTQKYLNSRDL